HIDSIVDEVDHSIDDSIIERVSKTQAEQKNEIVDDVARMNVQHTVDKIREQSKVLRNMEINREIAIVGAMYDVSTGQVDVITPPIS
ncbi:MAG TPA: hypothetical protein DIW81_03475, partial [Planctomycetaceae bacterium]|nr:hypothetical protein [Planctomycetaceae bacterium]